MTESAVEAGPMKRAPLTDQVTDALLAMISARGLSEGDSLPPVGEIAQKFEVSIPVVRESIAGLAALGLLRRQQGRETLVATPDAWHLRRMMGLRIAQAQIDDESIQQFREIVEVGSAGLAARNASSAEIVELEERLERLREASTEAELHEADVAFHAAVARAGGNDLLIWTLESLEPLLRRLRERVWAGWVEGGGDRDSIIEAHAAVLKCIRAGDEAGAAAAMTSHLRQARLGLDTEPAEPGPGSPAK